jgi:hypothetical protein
LSLAWKGEAMDDVRENGGAWPALPFEAWPETRQSLHMWTQIVGKIRLALSPPMNEWWQVPLYVTARGLGTSPIPYGDRLFELDFDLVDHQLLVRTSAGDTRALALWARRTCDFYREVLGVLGSLGIDVAIAELPCEVPDPVPFSRDERAGYDPAWARRFHRVLASVVRVLGRYRGAHVSGGREVVFAGKSSPVHFFWGSFDLAITRFAGRPAPKPPGTDRITRVAYDEQLMSVGFWPGSDPVREPAFYAYAWPEPDGFREAALPVDGATYHPALSEFVLPYERVRTADDPDAAILAFAGAAYEAAAALGRWDRARLERPVDPLEPHARTTPAGAALH